MFERYYLKPETIDRLRASWLSEPIEQYVQWLDEQGYSPRNVYRRVPILRRFGEFAQQQGAKQWSDLPAQVEPFVGCWVREHGTHYEEPPRWVGHEARTPVEQMLKLILPEFEGRGRSASRVDPFHKQVPGFFPFLQVERGLRESSMGHYVHYLHRFEAYLGRIGLERFSDLTPLVLSAFVIESATTLSKTSMTSLCSALRVFLRYLHQEGLTGRDLSSAIERPRGYRLAEIPRSIAWDEVRRRVSLTPSPSPSPSSSRGMMKPSISGA